MPDPLPEPFVAVVGALLAADAPAGFAVDGRVDLRTGAPVGWRAEVDCAVELDGAVELEGAPVACVPVTGANTEVRFGAEVGSVT